MTHLTVRTSSVVGRPIIVVELAGRDPAREAAIRSVRFGAGAVIAGDAGVGKTALAGAVADAIAARGVPVVRVLATSASRGIPYAALGPLLPLDSPSFHPALIPGLVLRALAELGGRHRPLLLVDDAQWLDDHSAAVLLSVIAQQGAHAVVTVRLGGQPSDAVTALWKDGLLERIDLLPLDIDGAQALLRSRLGGDVAAVTTALLWQHSQGNPLYLTELCRFGLATGRLTAAKGVWWWSGSADVPPRLAELLVHRLEDLSPAAAEACDWLALGEPLPYETLAGVAPAEAILELDQHGIIASDAGGGIVRLRFSHPLLLAVAGRRLSAARRQALASRLLTAPADQVDLLRRATWQEAAGGCPDVDLLVRAARALIVLDPSTAIRFAERAVMYDDGPTAAVTLADAQAEFGRPDLAPTSLGVARTRIRDDEDRVIVAMSDGSLRLWSLRQPTEALRTLQELAAELPPELAGEATSAEALLTLFSARPATADRIAERILAAGSGLHPPAVAARRRCLLVRLAAATLGDRAADSSALLAELTELLANHQQPASARSLSTAIAATAEMFGNRSAELPRAGGSTGQWPTPRISMDEASTTRITASLSGPAWPLLEGVQHHLAGNITAAAIALREATVQQLQGEGLFRSEAAGGLVVVLSECGNHAEARKVLRDNPRDDVTLIPGMRGWAEAWVLAGSGRVSAAGELAVQIAAQTAAAGAVSTAFWYLADAGRFGAVRPAAELAESLAGQVGAELTAARLLGVRARAAAWAEPLADAAEAHLAVGLFGHAAELAEQSLQIAGRSSARAADAVAARARRAASSARAELGIAAPAPSGGLPEQLTRREVEIARLAAQGMRDKDIADELVLSVRTVESHLATAYRKLGIGSRRELVVALGGAPGPLP